MKSIFGEVEVFNGIPFDEMSKKEVDLLVETYGESVLKLKKSSAKVKIDNRILWTGKSMVMDLIFNQRAYKIDTISAGDGAMNYSSGIVTKIKFQDFSYPTSYEVVPNEIFKKAIVDFGVTTNLDGERSRACAVLIDSSTDMVGVFNTENINKTINSLSLSCSGPGLPNLSLDFDGSQPIPFSNATIPEQKMNVANQDIMYINWVYRIV